MTVPGVPHLLPSGKTHRTLNRMGGVDNGWMDMTKMVQTQRGVSKC